MSEDTTINSLEMFIATETSNVVKADLMVKFYNDKVANGGELDFQEQQDKIFWEKNSVKASEKLAFFQAEFDAEVAAHGV
jgi:hypothetical protein